MILSTFPTLLTFEGFGPLIIRLTVGFTLAYFGYQKATNKADVSGSNSKVYGVVEMFVAAFLVIGLFTQVAALANAIILLIKLGHKINEKAFLVGGVNYYLLLLAMALSLIFTGPGYLAFDLPI